MRERGIKDVALPLAVYLVLFAALTWPLVTSFGRTYWCDEGDGLLNTWNLRQVERWSLGEVPLRFTDALHFPHGTSLAGHTLALLDCLLAIPLARVLGPVGAFDALVLLAFVGSGLSAYWLCLAVSGGQRGASLVGGALFGFSSYLFAHAEGHLNLITTQALPLFALALVKLCEKPGAARALLAAGALGLVGLSELSYAFYAGLFAGLYLVGRVTREGWREWKEPARVRATAVFTLASGLVALALAWPLLSAAAGEELLGRHSSKTYALDLLALAIPGGHWRFAGATEWYWSRLEANIHETSVHLGLGVLALVGIAAWRRKECPAATTWLVVFVGAVVLAFGPRLHVAGWEVPVVRLPYKLLEGMSSTIRLSGMPIRIVVLATLAAAVLSALALGWLFERGPRPRQLAAGLLLLALIEHLPRPIPESSPEVPAWVLALRDLPAGAAIDEVSQGGRFHYHQTIHGKPVAFGHLARLPRSVWDRDQELARLLQAGDVAALASAGFRWAVIPPGRALQGGDVVVEEPGARIVRLSESTR